jgi:hypothetical protein
VKYEQGWSWGEKKKGAIAQGFFGLNQAGYVSYRTKSIDRQEFQGKRRRFKR